MFIPKIDRFLTLSFTASPRFIVPDNMLVDAIERAKRDVSTIKDMEWNLWNTGKNS